MSMDKESMRNKMIEAILPYTQYDKYDADLALKALMPVMFEVMREIIIKDKPNNS